ncbi:hypothetical protein BDW59DRAFT_169147 [Aspergillus cavernicola]|uniref:Protein kinase domain-containing protein n=1 Tax=Aspergillus cavernicola TaxID=176166 RepID=A0ABR4IYN6_9EURO
MSVLPRHGGSYLQRRLTKMYTDTKTSCESVTTASNALDNPELLSIHRNFKTQRDRLLAWGLDWSDASAAQPNDIDESLTQAGFSDVVESVMSSIQDLLSQAERLLYHGASDLPSKGAKTDSPAVEGLGGLPTKTNWTSAEISRSKDLLNELTASIDVLYDLSRSRRDMNASSQPSGKSRTRSYPSPKVATTRDDSGYSKDSKPYRGASFDNTKIYQSSPTSKSKEAFEYSSFTNSHSITQSPAFEHPNLDRAFSTASVVSRSYVIDRSALQLTGASHDNNPPPYEMVAASTNSRVLGRMKTSALPFPHNITEPTVSILVEYTPMVLDASSNAPSPGDARLDSVHQTLDQLVQNARVSHLGLLNFLGYYIDRPNSRYAFVYQMPIDYFPYLQNPTDLLNGLKPKPLVSLLQLGENYPMPNLETRFRLAYDLLMAVLQLRSQNLVHGNINSSNVLIFPGLSNSNPNEVGLTENLRRPYLTSFAQFSGNNPSPEPLSASMYRHPDDKRSIDDDAAWAYDLYSLGLVLMEIGLWTPISRIWKMKYNTSIFKQRVESMYLKKLGPKCGTAFTHMVQLCLDAPNFHLSTQPFDDLNLRISQTFHYPVLDLSAPESTFSFSMNFLYTLCKITWSCCKIDIFNAPGADELDDCLPLALVPGSEADAAKQAARDYTGPQPITPFVQPLAVAPAPEMKIMKLGLEERKLKKRTFKKLTTVEIPQEHLTEWNFQMLPRLRKLLQKILKESSESCGVTLMMTGDGLDNAKTTICVTCSSVKKVRSALKRYFPLEREDWDLLVLRGDIERSKVPRKKRRLPAKPGPQSTIETPPSLQDPNPFFQQNPLCGASIGAFMNEEHLPPVSYGGAILVDGIPYGMTVHHMLEAPSDQEDAEDQDQDVNDAPLRSAGNWPRDMPTPDSQLMYTWCDEDPAVHNMEFEISDDEDGDDYYDDYALSDGYSSDEDDDDFAYDDEDAASIGDTAGIEPDEEPPLFVTQPAIDDVREDFFPSPDDRDDEHLASHAFGYVHASSGVRRWTRGGIKHEIDWALIKINHDRMDARNIVYDKPSRSAVAFARQRRGQPLPPQQRDPIHLNDIARLEDLGGLNVHCCGRTSGLQTGQISKAMTIVKLHGRQTFSTSFGVDGNFGVPGDSGAWVFEKSTGRVCGAVLAWSEKSRTAYIAPMEVLLEDIARTLQATHITLPGSPNDPLAYAIPHSPIPQNPRYRTPLPLPDQLPVDLNRQLRLDDPNVAPVNTSRGLRDPYHNLPPILTPGPGRSLERQLA